MAAVSLFVLGKLPGLNEYIDACRENRYKAAKLKREAESLVIWQARRIEKITARSKFVFTWYEHTRRRDPDNVAFAKKFVLDALQQCGKLKNDNSNFVSGFEDRFVYGNTQGVLIEIFEEDEK